MVLMILSIIRQKLVEKPKVQEWFENIPCFGKFMIFMNKCIPLVDTRPVSLSQGFVISSGIKNRHHSALDHDMPVVKSRRSLVDPWSIFQGSTIKIKEDEVNPLYKVKESKNKKDNDDLPTIW